jgi:general secretion pathway protein C
MGSIAMIKLSKNSFLNLLVPLVGVVLVAKMVGVGLWWYLPDQGEELRVKESYTFPYVRVDFKNMLPKKASLAKKKEVFAPSQAFNINSLILKGLYGIDQTGFAIIAKKSSPKKTTIISVGEQFAGYTLKMVAIDYVVLQKQHKEYILKLEKRATKPSTTFVKNVANTQEDDSNEYKVKKQDINYYAKHPSKIWRDIAIDEVKKDGKIIGFKVKRIRPKSRMATIGLKVGDLIIRANNVELQSYRDAIKLYKNINKIETLELVVLRNNQEKEIVYEIH